MQNLTIRRLWQQGRDTAWIAAHIGMREADVARIVSAHVTARAADQHGEITPTHWCVLWVAPSYEAKAAADIVRAGYAAFVPMAARWRKARTRQVAKGQERRIRIESPLLPRYVFAGLDPDRQPWRPLADAEGVVDVIRTDAGQSRLAAAIVALRAACDAGQYDETIQAAQRLAERMASLMGRKVRIRAGAFAGHEGIATRARGKTDIEVDVGLPVVVALDGVSEA
jgi:transcription antitermination factor NusG